MKKGTGSQHDSDGSPHPRRSEATIQPSLSQAGSLKELIAAIRRLSAADNTYEPPHTSLTDALAAQPDDPTFDLQAWTEEWARVEAEMGRIEVEDAAGDLAA